jgi:4a-hydroxytetrahydrobiopterin dehydratase
MAALTREEVEAALAEPGLDGWKLADDGGEIFRWFKFPTFMGAVAFINRLAEKAEAAAHHPDLENHYNRVRVALHTWSENGITPKDLALAREIQSVEEPA